MVANYGVCYFYWVVSEWDIWASLVLCWKEQHLIDVEKMSVRVALQNMCRFFTALSMIFWFIIKAMVAYRSHAGVHEIILVNLQKLDAVCHFLEVWHFLCPTLVTSSSLLLYGKNVIIFLWLKIPNS